MDANELWERVQRSFEEDDGSLPDLCFANLDGFEVAEFFRRVVAPPSRLSDPPDLYGSDGAKLGNLVDFADAGDLLGEEEIQAFFCAVDVFDAGGECLPWIGVYFFSDEVDICYRMGEDWDKSTVFALFEWLRKIQPEPGEPKPITFTGAERPPEEDALAAAWVDFVAAGRRGQSSRRRKAD